MSSPTKIRHVAKAVLLCSMWVTTGTSAAEAIQPLESIRDAAEAHVRRQIPGDPNVTIVTAGALDPRLRLVRCGGPLSTSVTAGSRLQPRMAVGVACREGVTWTVYVPVTVESNIPVLTLRTAAPRGARLAPQDVIVQNRRVSGFATAYIKDVSQLGGHTLKRPLPAGAALTADVLVADMVVRRGDQVTLLASTGAIEVRARGKALSDGRDGARIRVQNLESLKVVEGVIEGSHVIRVTP